MAWQVELLFPDDASAIDVTSLVRYGSLSEQLTAFSEDTKTSTIDVFSFHLNEDDTIRQKFLIATERIECFIDEDGERRFTGYIAPTFSTRESDTPDGIAVEAEDAGYLLDRPVIAQINLPATVGSPTVYRVFDKANPATSIVHQILQQAGYSLSSDIDTSSPDIMTIVEHFAVEEDESSYRDILDELLYEYRHAFTFNEEGQFKVIPWAFDNLTTGNEFNRTNILSSPGMTVTKRDIVNDGARVKYAILESIDDVRLYYSTSPPNTTPGEDAFKGWPIGAGDYYPPDSDIEDIYQQYKEDWLDVPYQTRQTRLRNKDIDLVSTSGHRLIYEADLGIAIDVEEYEAFRGRISFVNNASEARKLYAFEILGTALFRNSIRTARYPTTAGNPTEYVTKNVFDNVAAQELAIAIGNDIVFSQYRYSFESLDKVAPGELATIVNAELDINTTAVITSRGFDDEEEKYRYEAIGVTLFSTDTVLTEGQASANSGIQEQTALLNTPSFADIEGGEILVASYQYPSSAPASRNCTGDNDDVDINAAINDLVATFGGGRVKLTRGIYNIDGPINVRGNMAIEGDGSSTILLMRGSESQVRIGDDGTGSFAGADEVQLRNVKVVRVRVSEVDGGEPSTSYTETIDAGGPDVTYGTVDNIDGGTAASVFLQSTTTLLEARNSIDVWIIDSIFEDSYGDGLLFVNSNNITMRNCQVVENEGYGVVVRGAVTDGGTASTTTFEMMIDGGAPDTTTFDATLDGGEPGDTYSLNCIVSECYINGNLDGLWFVGDDGLIIDSYLTNNTFDGAIISGTDNQFHGNYCTGNGDNGVVISGNQNSCVGTRAKRNGGAGINITGDLVLVNGCIVQRNNTGILIGASADNVVLTGNAASNNDTNFTDNGTGTQSTGNLF